MVSLSNNNYCDSTEIYDDYLNLIYSINNDCCKIESYYEVGIKIIFEHILLIGLLILLMIYEFVFYMIRAPDLFI